MTIKDCIDLVDSLKPNQYSIREKVMWLSFIEEIIINEVLKTHEGYDGRYDNFEGYTEDKLSVTLIVRSPHDRLYPQFLKMKIDESNGEIARYNNSAALYNTYMSEFRKYYNKTHMPINTIGKRATVVPPLKTTVGLSDAEYENLKKDLTYILTQYFSDTISADKLYDIVTNFARNNIEMLKGKDGRDGVDGNDGYTPRKNIDYFDGKQGLPGKDGYSPIRGIDYYTTTDKREITKDLENYVDYQTEVIRSDVEGIQKRIKEEAHFKGYLSTNQKIQLLAATPNDFAYSAESGTKWLYEAQNGWHDTGIPVPDQLTPPSDTTPLINGIASTGTENAYARGDHRHPTDTTRASVEDVRALEEGKVDQAQVVYSVDEIFEAYEDIPTVEVTKELINPPPIETVPTTLEPNKQYNFGVVESLSLAFPIRAMDGAVIYLTFKSGATPTALTINTTNTCDIECIPEANTGYEIFGKYNGSIWIVNYSEYTISEG